MKLSWFIALPFSAFLPANVLAQEVIQLPLTLDWVEERTADNGVYSFFRGETFEFETSDLPIISKAYRISTKNNTAMVTIQNEITGHFGSQSFSDNGDSNDISSEFKVNAILKESSEDVLLFVEIFPFRRNSTTGRIEKLISCELEVTTSHNPNFKNRTLAFAENSVLSEGTWYKIALAKDGVYRIDKTFLSQLGIDVANLNPLEINIYGNGGTLLPFDNADFRFDDLQKNSIFVQGESDGQFNDNDFILFYGKGPDSWQLVDNKFVHEKHFYSDSSYYFIRTDDIEAKRITSVESSALPETHLVTKFQDFQFVESDLVNLAKGGREYYGDEFDFNTSANYSFSFPNITTDPASADFRVAARSTGNISDFIFSIAGSEATLSPQATGTGAVANVANVKEGSLSFIPQNSNTQVSLEFDKGNPEAVGWLDYIRLNVTRNLTMAGSQMRFRDTTSVGPGNVALFQLAQATNVNRIWDVTDLTNVFAMNFDQATVSFKTSSESLREYVALTSSGFLTPTPIGNFTNQNLHALSGIDLVIVTAPDHYDAASELAEIHTAEGMTVLLTTPERVFNEFSSGNPDVTAIKMLMKMLYDRAEGDPELMPQNLLLFGDGSYNNKSLYRQNGSNVITYQAANSVSPVGALVSDDYFVFLDDDESESTTDMLDCGVGRIPATDVQEGIGYVNKVKAYIAQNTSTDGDAYCIGDETQSPYGAWRNIVTFISDDQDGSGGGNEAIHMSDSDSLSRIVYNSYNDYDVVKIYMDAYKQESTAGGERYPEGEEAIRQRIQNGSLVVNYLGHGGERGWAHERILDINTIENWTNINRLPVFLTATCELARYDDPGYNSAGEILVMSPTGGAIAMLTTTRIVYSGSNFELDNGFYKYALENESMPGLTLGQINRLTKNWVSSSDSNKRNFSLLGDPALKMSYPQQHVYTTEINGQSLPLTGDPLKALQEVEFKGYVGDAGGNILSDFNGFVYPSVFDKRTEITTQNNDEGINFQYDVYNRILYKGKASVVNGEFTFKFVVPFDINYSVGTGRVSYYAVAGSLDGHGHSEEFNIGGTLEGAQLNTVGPEIELFINDSTFVSGGISSENPIILAKLKDENGINTVGNGIGHDLQAILDGDNQNPIILNDYYESDLDTYKSGEIRYQLSDLPEGNHNLTLKVWDVHNNSSDESIEFVVAPSADIALEHVLNYPNPFTTHTDFYFEHNQACESLDVQIQVFTVGGKLVKTINENVLSSGFRSEPIAWNGRDDFGDKIGRGVYVYKVKVLTPEGSQAEKFEKLVILN